MLRRLRLALAGFAVALFAALPASAFETRATVAWVYDLTTGTVLLDKGADLPVPPASMSKLMTVNMLFEALKDGRVALDTTFAVSSRAKGMGGSTMFLNEMDRPTVDDLIHGIIVNSGNDACVVVAEGLAGSEEAFAALMNERAKALGLENSHFANASGWPDPGQRMSMHDLGQLAVRLITEFPDLYPYFSVPNFNYKDRAEANSNNRNPLLKIGGADWHADGLKTGHTEEAGYGMVGSAVMGDRRVVFAFAGLPSEKDRAEEAEQIASWAFRQFALKTVVKAGAPVAEAEVALGAQDKVALVAASDLRLLIPAQVQGEIAAEAVYRGPLVAPIAAGQQVGELIIRTPGLAEARVPLLAETGVEKAGFFKRLSVAFQVLKSRYFGDDSSG